METRFTRRCAVVLVACLLSVVTPRALGSVHPYNGQRFFQKADAWLFRGGREGLFSSTPEAQAHWLHVAKGVANGKAYVRFSHLRVTRPPYEAMLSPLTGETGVVEALLFEVADLGRIGYTSRTGLRYFCCSQELVPRTGCKPGHIIVRPRDGDAPWPRVVEINFVGNATEVKVPTTEIPITETGMYYLWFVICDKNMADAQVHGATVWKNPGGYLPGMMYPFLNFYGLMSLLYLGLGFFWLLQYARFWRDILSLQNCITAVVGLTMVEMASWYFDFVNFNATGFRPYGITLWAVALGAVRKTVSRLLILVVSMGFGVVRPTLGGLSRKVLLLGGTYLAAAACLDVMQNVGAIDDLTSGERIMLVLPVAVLDAIFILWIFTALSKTLTLLQAKRITHKLHLYRKFTNTLALTAGACVAWIGYETYFKVTDQLNERWQSDWILAAFWHVLAFVLLGSICVLWAPSQSSTRYAYSDDAIDDEDDVPLTGETRGEDKPAATEEDSAMEEEREEAKLA